MDTQPLEYSSSGGIVPAPDVQLARWFMNAWNPKHQREVFVPGDSRVDARDPARRFTQIDTKVRGKLVENPSDSIENTILGKSFATSL